MDLARWWDTKGQLGRLGALALRRGFPRTHFFAQARSVFAVAAHRSSKTFDPPLSVTLFRLTEAIEEAFDARWEAWLDDAPAWTPFFERLQTLALGDLPAALRGNELVSDDDLTAFARLKRSSDAPAVPLKGLFSGTIEDIAQLALGFARGEPGALAVPYARRGDV